VGGIYDTLTPPASGAWTVMSATGENNGPIVSTTVTVNVALDWLPSGSDAVHVTGVDGIVDGTSGVLSGNVVLGGGTHATVTPEFPVSIAVGGMKNTFAPAELVA
jgi:hypothetical protein